MPMTAYSVSEEKEIDVYQLLAILSGQPKDKAVASLDGLPDPWRVHIKSDMQCPCCFVTGAEVVKEAVSRTTRKAIRQPYFRFVTPGHREHCDFAMTEAANAIPENLVAFGDAKTKLTRAVRDLVCTGIDHRVFNQRSIRNMREWFFNKKIGALFMVMLDTRLPDWIEGLHRAIYAASGGLPADVPLTAEIAAMPNFDWRTEAARRLIDRYRQHIEILEALRSQRIYFLGVTKRVESLARRFQGRVVFDPSVLAEEYDKTRTLARFVSCNYKPLKPAKQNDPFAASVLALCALLLFCRDWDMNLAISDFTKIAAASGHSDQTLGNVMGLNPFHDYEAWRSLKQMQALNIVVPQNTDLKAEKEVLEAEIRTQFANPFVS